MLDGPQPLLTNETSKQIQLTKNSFCDLFDLTKSPIERCIPVALADKSIPYVLYLIIQLRDINSGFVRNPIFISYIAPH